MDSEVNDVKKYSVILGFSMIVIFIIPCVLLAFFSKYLVRSGPTSKVYVACDTSHVPRLYLILRAQDAHLTYAAYFIHAHLYLLCVGHCFLFYFIF